MPLVKTSGCVSTGAKKALKFVKDNKVPIAALGGVTGIAAGVGYRSRAKERAREEALVNDIVARNLQKEAAMLPFMRALGSGLKSVASGIGGGLKTGVKGMANTFENAGFKGVANGINTAGKWGMNAGRAVANTAKNVGQWGMNAGKKAWGTMRQWGQPAANVAGAIPNQPKV